jgi:hypothetical protein
MTVSRNRSQSRHQPRPNRSHWSASPSVRRDARIAPILLIALIALGAPFAAAAETPPATKGATVEILSPADGATVTSPVLVQFGLAGMGVAPAGVERDNTGHHHLIIDAKLPDLSLPIPSNAHYRHFGGGQTQVSVELEPGTHTLQLLLGNYLHIPHDSPIVSKPITITVTATP